jgi:hypothetical protein
MIRVNFAVSGLFYPRYQEINRFSITTDLFIILWCVHCVDHIDRKHHMEYGDFDYPRKSPYSMSLICTVCCLLSAAIEELLRSIFRQAILLIHAIVLVMDDTTTSNKINTSVPRQDHDIVGLKHKNIFSLIPLIVVSAYHNHLLLLSLFISLAFGDRSYCRLVLLIKPYCIHLLKKLPFPI